MTDETPRHALPYIMPAQAQKHVTHNEALMRLDGIVQLVFEALDADTPPDDPAPGATYALGASPSGAWHGEPGAIAVFHPEGWRFLTPAAGFLGFDKALSRLVVFDGAGWIDAVAASDPAPADRLGVNAQADDTNRLSVKSDAVLFSHDDVTPGSGDMRLVINKAAAAGAAELLFQSGWSARALFGLSGDDRFVIKLSADGSAFTDALTLEPSGPARFAQPIAPPSFSYNARPPASEHVGSLIRLTTGPHGVCLAMSDGAEWRPLQNA